MYWDWDFFRTNWFLPGLQKPKEMEETYFEANQNDVK